MYVYPSDASGTPTGGQIFAAATYGTPRPDVAAAFGPQFANSGYTLKINGLGAGYYRMVVYARNVLTGQWQPVDRVISVPPPAMAVDAPASRRHRPRALRSVRLGDRPSRRSVGRGRRCPRLRLSQGRRPGNLPWRRPAWPPSLGYCCSLRSAVRGLRLRSGGVRPSRRRIRLGDLRAEYGYWVMATQPAADRSALARDGDRFAEPQLSGTAAFPRHGMGHRPRLCPGQWRRRCPRLRVPGGGRCARLPWAQLPSASPAQTLVAYSARSSPPPAMSFRLRGYPPGSMFSPFTPAARSPVLAEF